MAQDMNEPTSREQAYRKARYEWSRSYNHHPRDSIGFQPGFDAGWNAREKAAAAEREADKAALRVALKAIPRHHVENCQSYGDAIDFCATGCPMVVRAAVKARLS
jgi:hypothetical protein